jgi:sugar phosphate isomerase/epimerase
MKMNRREFVAALSMLSASMARAMNDIPTSRNIKWACSEATWGYYPPEAFTDILDVMKDTGFDGIRITGFPNSLKTYGITQAQMQSEVSKRGLQVVTISWNGPLQDPARRQESLDSARTAMKFLADFGANHLVVFPPNRNAPGANTPAGFKELCDRCNQIGEIAGEMGFTAGLHNHMNQMVQTQEEVDRFMSMTDPKLFGLSPDTCHLNLGGCNVVATFEKYKDRIRFMDYKDSKWVTPTQNWVEANGRVVSKDSEQGKFLWSSVDLGDGEIDFPGCHRVLKSVNYKGYICCDLDGTRFGPFADLHRCGAYIVKNLEPIYL